MNAADGNDVRGPLDGVTVLDLTRNFAGPFCTMTLGDLGARVLKVERPGVGDDTRAWRPPEWEGRSPAFLSMNRNKESIALDIDDPADLAALHDLTGRVDIVVEASRGDSMSKRGLDYESVRARNDSVVYCSITGFGFVGPESERPGYDAIVQAASGVMSINGDPKGEPARVGPSIVDVGTGMWAAIGLLAALRRRDRDGGSQHLTTSLLETGLVWMGYHAVGFLGDGTIAGRLGSRHASVAPYEAFETADGHLLLAALNDGLYRKLCHSLGLPELAEDPRFLTNPRRVENRDELSRLLQASLLGADAATWERRLRDQGLPCSIIKTIDEVVEDPQVEALGMLGRWPHAAIEGLRLVEHPVTYDDRRVFRRDGPPEIGDHTEAVLREFGLGPEVG